MELTSLDKDPSLETWKLLHKVHKVSLIICNAVQSAKARAGMLSKA